jgi:hypothetical protein
LLGEERTDTLMGSSPQELGDEEGSPAVRAEQIAEAFGGSGSVLGRAQVGAKLTQKQTVGTVAPLEDRDEGGEKGTDQADIELLVEGAQQRLDEVGQALLELKTDLRAGLQSGRDCGRILSHTKPPLWNGSGNHMLLRRFRFVIPLSKFGMTHVPVRITSV